MSAHSARWERTGVLLALTLVLGAGACGDDDDESSVSTAASEPVAESSVPATAEAGSEADEIAAGCALDVEIDTAFNEAPFPEGDEPPTEEQIQTIRDYMTAEVAPLLERAEALNIPELEDDIETTIAPIRAFIETGDAAVFDEQDPASVDADVAISKFFFDNCDGAKLEVSGTEYEFSEPQGPLDVDQYRVKLTNDGKEAHEFVVFRKADGVTETFDEIFALPEEEGQEKVAFVGIVEPIDPGKEQYSLISIDEPGDYVAVCFIPVGTPTVDAIETTDGAPHFTEGMKIEFTAS